MSAMNQIREIRQALGLTQDAMAQALGCRQGAISFYEVGRSDPLPDTAREIIKLARSRGLPIGFDHIYGDAEIPKLESSTADAQTAAEG